MQSVDGRAQLEAMQVLVLETLTLHLAGQPYPLVRIATRQRQDPAGAGWMASSRKPSYSYSHLATRRGQLPWYDESTRS